MSKQAETPPQPAVDPPLPRNPGDLDENVVRLLLLGFRASEQDLLSRAAREGYGDIRLPHFPILRGINEGLVRMTDIAASAGITKQTAGALALELEALGYIARLPDPQDGRAKVLRFTQRGRDFVQTLPALLIQTERRLAELVGGHEVDRLAATLQTIVDRAALDSDSDEPTAGGR